MTALLTALTTGAAPQDTLAQATQTIEDWSSWIASQASANAGDQSAIIDTVKAHASTWYNSIAPNYFDMPSTLVNLSSEVNGDLTMLVSLAEQCSGQGGAGDPVESAIKDYATKLQATVQQIATQTTNLALALRVYATDVASDYANACAAKNELQQEISACQSNLNQLYGRLHQLQSGTCPSRSDIANCQGDISTAQQKLDSLDAAAGFVSAVCGKINGVSGAATYLGSYWGQVSVDASNSTRGLSQILADPVIIMKLELDAVQNNWNQLVQGWQTTSQTLATQKAA